MEINQKKLSSELTLLGFQLVQPKKKQKKQLMNNMVSQISNSEIQKSPIFLPMRKEWTRCFPSISTPIGSKIIRLNICEFSQFGIGETYFLREKFNIFFSICLPVQFLYFYINRIQLVNVPTRFFANLISMETVSWTRMNLLKAVWMTATS